MDKRGKLVIVVLLLLGLVFAISLGTHLIPKDNDEQIDGSGWLQRLDDLAAPFRHPLDPSRLRPGADCRQQNGGYAFNREAMACDIRIAGAMQDKYQTATLVVTNAATIRLPCGQKPDSTATRGTASALRPSALRPVEGIRLRPDRISAGGAAAGHDTTPTSASMEVIYTPAGEDPPLAVCAGEPEIRLVVLKAGGRLSLRCTGCSASQVVQVQFND